MAERRSRSAAAAVVTVFAVVAVVLAGCSSMASPTAATLPSPLMAKVEPATAPTLAPPLTVNVEPTATGDVAPSTEARVTTSGVLESIALTGSDGHQVPGVLSADRHVWTASEHLAFGQTYTWSGNAVAGREHRPVTGTFTTAAPARLDDATLNLDDGQTVGVAAPVIIQFDGPVRDKAAVERALSVHTTVPTEGSWAWLPDNDQGSRVHWRPRDYWKPGTQVDVAAKLYGVPLGNGTYGRADLSARITIGRSQIVKADVASHQLVVLRDGQQVASYPASYGLASDPDRTTRSGVHVVTERDATERMRSTEFHYDVVEHWAVRISNNGEFIHANPATVADQGNSNVTHGCINLSTADAQTYFDSALYGDPVEVTNSGIPLSADDGDIYDWTIPWDQWHRMSALA